MLDTAPGLPLSQVVGPSGSGKSELLRIWSRGRDVVWLTPDDHDALLGRLLVAHGAEADGEDAALATLAGGAAGASPVLVVLDDAHRSTASTRRLLGRLATEAPGAASVVLVGREEVRPPDLPPPGVAPVLLRGPDLAFTDDEAAALVRLWAPTLARTDAARVVAQAHGWAAALLVGALGAGDAAPAAWASLAEFTLDSLGPSQRSVLVATCEEETLDAQIVTAMTGDPEAPAVLTDLARQGLLVREDAEASAAPVWTVHQALRQGLRARSREDDGLREVVVSAHLRAVEALTDPEEVVRHAISSGRTDTVVAALRRHGGRLVTAARLPLLSKALDALPRDVRGTDPAVLVLDSMVCRLSRRFEDASRIAVAAARTVDEQPGTEQDEQVLDWIALMAVWRSRCGWADPREAIARATARLRCRHEDSGGRHLLAPGQTLEWTGWLMAELVTVQTAVGDLDEAGLHLSEFMYNARLLDQDQMLAAGLAHRAFLELVEASFQTAAATARAGLDLLGGQPTPQQPYGARSHLVLGWAAVHELDLIAAHEHLAAAEEHPAAEIDPLVVEMLHLLDARLLAEEGLVEDARRLLAEHGPGGPVLPRFVRRLAAIVGAQVAALAGDLAALREEVRVLADLGYQRDAQLFEAVLLAGEGRTDLALHELEDLLRRPRLDVAVGAGAAALRVGLLLRTDDADRAAELLPDLLSRVAPQRMLQVLTTGFLGGNRFVDLLQAEAARPDGHPFAAEALSCIGRYARPFPDFGARRVRPVAEALAAPAPPLDAGSDAVSRLTPRERDVLAELALGGSYGDVARALFVSENTVKTHLGSVYRKLGVDRRVDALRIARDQDLL